MEKKIIVVAGASGNLGNRIVKYLIESGAQVRVIVRPETNYKKIIELEEAGALICKIEKWTVEEISKICINAHCVVSALAGLKDVILGKQKILLDSVIASGVRRFIPSDYSLDFTKFKSGENRNLDWRRNFHEYLENVNLEATTIFNGAFTDLLTNEMPLILLKQKMVLYWGSSNHKLCFTTINDTAKYTANVALEISTPRFLRIAGDLISPRELKEAIEEVSGNKYRLFRAGSLSLLSFFITIARFFSKGEKEIYPAWQGMQYMRNMIDSRATLGKIDNDRFSNINWTKAKDVLKTNHIKLKEKIA